MRATTKACEEIFKEVCKKLGKTPGRDKPGEWCINYWSDFLRIDEMMPRGGQHEITQNLTNREFYEACSFMLRILSDYTVSPKPKE